MVRRRISGEECVVVLCKYFGFPVIRQKGSHIVLKKESSQGIIGTVVPNHKELKTGTLKRVLKLGKVSEKEFERLL